METASLRLVLLFAILLLIAVPVVRGFVSSRRQRGRNRRDFATFVGFSAAVVALTATIFSFAAGILWSLSLHDPYAHPGRQGLVFVSELIGLAAVIVAFLTGLLSVGVKRITLLAFGAVMFFVYVLAAFSNFGN